MKNKKVITILAIAIAILASFASYTGIFSSGGSGEYFYQSIRGESVKIYGTGLYQHMSKDVAIQGIAQDYITLFLCVPLLLVSLFYARKGSLKSRFLFAGVLNYFLLTYLFYLNMAMYNSMFLIYIILLGTTFFAFVITLLSIDIDKLPGQFKNNRSLKFVGGFLIFTAVSIALLWLGVIIPPLMDHSIIPHAVEHYTTLTVQGFDLSIFLPISFVGGFLLIKRNKYGYLMSSVTIVFLPLLMLALVSKIITMAMAGVNVVPAIYIIPAIAVTASVCCVILMNGIIHEK